MIYLRKATYKDCETLFKWVNDYDVRKNSFNTESISIDNHIKWFKKKLLDKNCTIFIVHDNKGNYIGQVRIDKEVDRGLIDYSIDSIYRGQGLGKEILSLIKKYLKILFWLEK